MKKIYYPTGGHTEYNYEANDASQSFAATFIEGYASSDYVPRTAQLFKSTIYLNPNASNKYSNVFNVENSDGEISFATTIAGYSSSDYNDVTCPVAISVFNNQTNQLVASISAPSVALFLPDGQYRIEALVKPFADPSADFAVQISWQSDPDPLNETVGGLRIKKIISKDGFGGQIAKEYEYRRFDNAQLSSGCLANMPIYRFYMPCASTINLVPAGVLRLVSSSSSNISFENGQVVTYTDVREKVVGDAAAPKPHTDYRLIHDQFSYTNPKTSTFPFARDGLRDWRNGLMLGVQHYTALQTGNPKMVGYERTSYQSFDFAVNDSFGLKAGVVIGSSVQPYIIRKYYTSVTERFLPTEVRSATFASNGGNDSIETVTQKVYNHLSQLVKQTSVNSEAQTLETTFKYPIDYVGVAICDSLLARNQFNAVLESTERNVTLNKTIQRNEIVYGPWQQGKFYRPQMFKSSVGSGGLEVEGTILAHDESGNVLSRQGKNGIVTTLLYGYNKQYPVAQITNATHAQAIALVSQAILDNPSSDAALRTELNKLRTGLPANAQITTYTYAPLIGITSQTDPNGRTTIYEYDAFGRLLRIKDHDGNTIKQMDYQYQKPVTN